MKDYEPMVDPEKARALAEVMRTEAILAELDPDRLGRELPPDMPESAREEWEEFVALCDRLDAEESSSSPRRGRSDRSAGCM